MSSLVIAGDTSGAITVAAPAVAGSNTQTLGANSGIIISDANTPGYRNRIINGAMMIDQRNAGASLAISSTAYGIDRWKNLLLGSGTGRYSVQRSTNAPAGFSNSEIITVTTADASPSALYGYGITQQIEGYNVADFGWGTANAQTVTISFWVRSSVTGLYAANIGSDDGQKQYCATYTINSANTWEYKTLTVAGSTSGTFPTDNTASIAIIFGLGGGSSRIPTANNTWFTPSGGTGYGATQALGGVNFMATNGATFYITGVQLEKGSTATSFDYRPYGTELALCQRYLPAVNLTALNQPIGFGLNTSATASAIQIPFKVSARVPPTGISASSATNFYLSTATGGVAGTYASTAFNAASTEVGTIACTTSTGLVAGNVGLLFSNSSSAQILFTGCEL